MIENAFIKGQFLIAMPQLKDTFFEASLVYLLEHNDQGASGFIVNLSAGILVGEVLQQINESFDPDLDSNDVINGGPCESDRGFVLHRPTAENWQGLCHYDSNISLTNSADILEAKAAGENIHEYLVALGYSSWAPGQLEQELCDNHWLNVSCDATTILSLPYQERLPACLDVLGIDYQQLSSQLGHG